MSGIRHPVDVARDFVREQSQGEWDDETIVQDSMKLASVIQAEREKYSTAIKKLVSALERTERNFKLAVAGKPVRDMAENLAECSSAIKAARVFLGGV